MKPDQLAPVAVVTGGSFGIGIAIARRLSADGAIVAIIGRDQVKLKAAVASLGAGARAIAADIGERVEVEGAIGEIVAAQGRIDILVNNAGVMPTLSLETPDDEAERLWDDTLRINLKGSYLVAKAAAPHMTAPGGRIINITSIVAQSGGSTPGYLAYAASKAGLNGLTLALARELAPRGITVNGVAPGGWDDSQISRIRGLVALGRPGHVSDIAGAVAWLASKDATYVTGTIIAVNGGWRSDLWQIEPGVGWIGLLACVAITIGVIASAAARPGRFLLYADGREFLALWLLPVVQEVST